MSELLGKTVLDLRCGRTTWRVLVLLCLPALCAGLLIGVH
jgi:hypothetical protein